MLIVRTISTRSEIGFILSGHACEKGDPSADACVAASMLLQVFARGMAAQMEVWPDDLKWVEREMQAGNGRVIVRFALRRTQPELQARACYRMILDGFRMLEGKFPERVKVE